MSLVVPAVLPASKNELEEKLAFFASIPAVSRVQIDVVDGKFASPASWPYSAPTELARQVEQGDMLPELDRIAYEIDLMCFDAEQATEAWLALGATRFTLHAESATNLPQLLDTVRESCGVNDGFAFNLTSFGLALNIASDLALIEPYLGRIEYVQFMGIVRIGRQGQSFDERVFEKVRIFHARHPDIAVQIDGGVSLANAKKLIACGVSNLVVGSAILRASKPASVLAEFEALQTSYGV